MIAREDGPFVDETAEMEGMLSEPEPEQGLMSDDELVDVIDREIDSAYGGNSEVVDYRMRALAYYRGEARYELEPPAITGRSSVVSRDVQETVAAMMPGLMRTFCGSEEIARFEPQRYDDEQGASDATTYANYIVSRRNPGYELLHGAIKNALIQREGYLKVTWAAEWQQTVEVYEGLSEAELQVLSQDTDMVITSVTEMQPVMDPQADPNADPNAPPMLLPRFAAEVRKRVGTRRCKIDAVPPDEVRIDMDARSMDEVRFAAHCRDITASELRAMGFDDELLERMQTDNSIDLAGEATDRSPYGSGMIDILPSDESMKTYAIEDAWLLVDYDKDGVAEWRHVMKSGSVILLNEQTDGHPFVLFTPNLMPHQLVGESVFDQLEDVQRIKTATLRQTIDNMMLTNNQRFEIVDGAVNVDDMIVSRPGGVVRVTQSGAVRALEVPVIIGQSLPMLEALDRVRERRTGVSEMSAGLEPSSVNRNSSGFAIDLMQTGARERMELVARTIAETAIKRLFRLVLRCITRYQTESEQVRLNGRWMEFDPRSWSNQYDITVSVGINAQSKQAQLASIDSIMETQRGLVAEGVMGPDVRRILNTVRRKLEIMGFRDADQFFPSADEIQPPEPPDPSSDPAVMAAQIQSQAIVQGEQIKAAQRTEEAQIKAQLEVSLAQMKAETDREISAMDIACKERIAAAQLNRDWAKLEQESVDQLDRISTSSADTRERVAQDALERAQQAIADAERRIMQPVSKPRVKVSSIKKQEDGSYVVDTVEQDVDDEPAQVGGDD